MKVDREAVASLVSRFHPCTPEHLSHRFQSQVLPQLWAMSMGPREWLSDVNWRFELTQNLPFLVLNVDQFGRFMT